MPYVEVSHTTIVDQFFCCLVGRYIRARIAGQKLCLASVPIGGDGSVQPAAHNVLLISVVSLLDVAHVVAI